MAEAPEAAPVFLSDDEKRQRLRNGDPLEFVPVPPGSESAESQAARTLQASWIAELAERHTLRITVPLTISNAIIEGPLSLAYSLFECGVTVRGCEFQGTVNLRYVTFKRGSVFRDSVFKEAALFDGARIEGEGGFQNTVFHSRCSLLDTHFSVGAFFSGAQFKDEASFDRSVTGGNAGFGPSEHGPVRFAGEARFHGAHIGGQANFEGAQFERKASFDNVMIGRNAYFDTGEQGPVRFAGEARFHGAHIGGQAKFEGVQFEQKAAFDGARIDGDMSFTPDRQGPVRFMGEARFAGTRIGGQAQFVGAQFEQDALFDGVEIKEDAFFRLAKQGPVRFAAEAGFVDAHIGGQLVFEGTQFNKGAFFNSASISGFARFGGVRNPVQFLDEVQFIGTRVAGQASFRGTKFQGGATFEFATLETAMFIDSEFSAGKAACFLGTNFVRGANLDSAKFHGGVDFSSSTSAGPVSFRETRFFGTLGLTDAHLHHAEFDLDGADQFASTVDLRGFTYDRIVVDWRKLLTKLEPYDRQPYTELEKFFRTGGHEEEADQVYFQRRAAEGQRLKGVRRFWDLAYKWAAGYGTRNWPLGVFLALLLAVGLFVFTRPDALDWSNHNVPAPYKNWVDAAGVSLRLIIRLDMPAGNGWEPSKSRVAWLPLRYSTYATIHMLLAWMTLPFIAASITDRIRRRRS